MCITMRTLLIPTRLYTQFPVKTAGCSHWLRNIEREGHGFVSGTCYSETAIDICNIVH